MTNKTQEDRIVKRLLERGFITRNECLKVYISKLSSHIWKLKTEDGWDFDSDYVKTSYGQDYKYTVTKCPFKKVERFIPALNRTIVSYEKLSTVVQNKS